MKVSEKIDKDVFQKYEKIISVERREKIKKYYFDKDKKHSLIAEILLRYSLKTRFNISKSEIQFIKNSFGKPLLKNFEKIHFNLSHSGDWAVCGVNYGYPIGVDVEQIKEINLQIAESFFTTEECDYILNKPQKEAIETFYNIWTLKESYVKAEGKGLNIPLNSFSFHISSKKIQLYEENKLSKKYYFQIFYLDDFHVVSICSKNIYNEKISIISIDDINLECL
ncbi:4'-phosphopantetheinyl transferase family protein [Clostridium botulinum]|nr:4'-phosphopantetheinyl transferase superfamily protein [Clostridium botulinum]